MPPAIYLDTITVTTSQTYCSSYLLFPLNAFKILSLIFDVFGHRLFLFLSCLEFAIFLESVGLCISENLGCSGGR